MKAANKTELRMLINRMLDLLMLIDKGFKSGNIKSKPVLAFDPNAESCELEDVGEMVAKLIAEYDECAK